MLSFLKWYRKYGEVYTYWISELPVVAICGHEKMIETFQKDGEAYAGKFTFDKFNQIIRGKLCENNEGIRDKEHASVIPTWEISHMTDTVIWTGQIKLGHINKKVVILKVGFFAKFDFYFILKIFHFFSKNLIFSLKNSLFFKIFSTD